MAKEQKRSATSSKQNRNKDIGARGEACAARYLAGRGYDVLDTNWQCALGEIDIVCTDRDQLVFVEVKTRTSCKRGFPEEAVDRDKRRKYELLAANYLAEHDYVDMPVRFDVVAVLVIGDNRAFIRHNLNAFSEWE